MIVSPREGTGCQTTGGVFRERPFGPSRLCVAMRHHVLVGRLESSTRKGGFFVPLDWVGTSCGTSKLGHRSPRGRFHRLHEPATPHAPPGRNIQPPTRGYSCSITNNAVRSSATTLSQYSGESHPTQGPRPATFDSAPCQGVRWPQAHHPAKELIHATIYRPLRSSPRPHARVSRATNQRGITPGDEPQGP